VVNDSLVSDRQSLGSNCEADYENALGVTTSDGTLTQRLVTKNGENTNIGSRLYLLDSTGERYEYINFIGKEISYDLDVSQIPCGVNAALYSVEMPLDGTGTEGAKCGTGYCDANYTGGTGCAELDIQEANNQAMAITTHQCQFYGQSTTSLPCFADGCGFNTYRYGGRDFWGTTIDPMQKMRVVTQVLGAASSIAEIRRKYVQKGKVIDNPTLVINNVGNFSSISDSFCKATDHYTDVWGTQSTMGVSVARGHVLVFSLWDSDDMGWLDADENGPCPARTPTSEIESQYPNMTVTWSNLRFRDIDTTY
jgi:hypothetical protein